jgi:hypothetical protein
MDLECLDFEDLDDDLSLAGDNVVETIPYVPRTLTKSELLQAFYSTRFKLESIVDKSIQPVTLVNLNLCPYKMSRDRIVTCFACLGLGTSY